MHRVPSLWRFLVLLAGCASILLACGGGGVATAAEVDSTIEWAEPVDGHWWDPLRWRDSATGAPRVPTASDRAHIATFVNQSFSVFVDPLGTGQSATVESLTVGSPDTDCCVQSGDARCWAALTLRGAKLTVRDSLLVNPFGVLRFTNSPSAVGEGELSALVSPNTTIKGWVQGSVTIQGNLDILPGSQGIVATLHPNATVQHRWGNWFIEGNLTVYNRTEFLFDENATTKVAQIKATTLVVPAHDLPDVGLVALPADRNCSLLYRNGITVFLFGSANTGLQPSFFLYDNIVGTPAIFVAAVGIPSAYGTKVTSGRCAYFCPGDGTGNPQRPGAACSSTSSHSFALLLGGVGGSQSCSCPPGTTGSQCQNYYCPGIPECSGRGTCSSDFTPPRCVCPAGWAGFACEIPDCPGHPACSNNGLCVSNTASPPFCRCDANWTGPAGQPNDCSVPVCSNNCTSPDNGVCTAADSGLPHCQCLPGWALGPDLDCSVRNSMCPGRGGNECSGRGSCNRTSGECSCAEGWRGADCSHADCPGSPDCNHHGECVVVTEGAMDTVQCQCAPGWTVPDCSQAACAVDGVQCSGHGKCVDVGLDPPRCVCSAGWTGPNCSVALTDCTTGVTPHCVACAGNATAQYCTSCEADWRGADCNTPYCLSGNDFRVFPECSGHGACSMTGAGGSPACQCRSGWLAGPLNDCATPLCAAGDEETECSGHGVCSTDLASPACMCDAFFYGNSCSAYEPACPGYPAECTNSAQGTCVNGTCECADGWRGADCSVVRCPGAKENCNGRGECDSSVEPAECRCQDNWTGPDCATPICPGDCSGNGKCSDATNPPVCECMPYWGGPDCSRSEQRSSSDDESATTYAAIGGGLGGGVVLLMVGVVAAIALFKGISAYKAYQINRSLKIGQVNFELENADPDAL